MKLNRSHVAAAGMAATMALGLAVTGTSAEASPVRTATRTAAVAATNVRPSANMTDFGAACAAVPKSGAGSFGGMTSAPVATAASNNPVLSTLVKAVKAAGLVDTLNNAKALTVFAPDNAAFAKLPKATLSSVLANKMELTKLLEYHVVAGRLSPSQLAGKHTTIEGAKLSIAGSGTTFNVNGTSQVVCGDVQTANATVYIVNTVLMPPSM